MELHFENVTPDNWRVITALKVNDEQQEFVASNTTILARAFVYGAHGSRVYALFHADVPIGLLMQRDYLKDESLHCVLDQFMIDRNHQGKGYGKAAMRDWLTMIKTEDKYDAITLCYKQEDEVAKNLYLGLGFQHTGEVDEDEIIMQYNL